MSLRPILLLLLLTSICMRIDAQRFSLLAEVGGLRTQIDGDKIQGFHYNGYTFGIGTNYAINQENFISVKTSYYKQGSTRKDAYQPDPRNGIQLEVDLNTVGLELGYKYDPEDRPHFMGLSFLRHQVVDLQFEIFEAFSVTEDAFVLNTEILQSSYISAKVMYGTNLFPRAEAYLSFEVAITNLVQEQQLPLRSLAPYAISAVFSYEIIAPKFEDQKQRPGSKSRSGAPVRKKRRR